MTKEADLDKLEELQIAHCLEMMEHLQMIDIGHNAKLPFKERIACMIMINTIRKDARKGKDDSDTTGSAVRKYTKSFAHAGRRQRGDTGRDADAGIDTTEDDTSTESPTQQ